MITTVVLTMIITSISWLNNEIKETYFKWIAIFWSCSREEMKQHFLLKCDFQMTLDYGSLDSQPDLCTIKFESHRPLTTVSKLDFWPASQFFHFWPAIKNILPIFWTCCYLVNITFLVLKIWRWSFVIYFNYTSKYRTLVLRITHFD